MLHVISFTFNPFQENTYLLVNEHKQCWIVDPGAYGADEEKLLKNYIAEHQLLPQQIINTHAHIDHIFGVDAVKQAYNIPFGIHQLETPILGNAKGAAMLFGFQLGAVPTPDFYIDEHKPLKLGDDTLEVRLAPGHSPGSIVFYYEPGAWVIGGDVLFNGSVGRTDLPGGSHQTLMESISQQLYTLPDTTKVYSGHGPATYIGREKETNPFVRG